MNDLTVLNHADVLNSFNNNLIAGVELFAKKISQTHIKDGYLATGLHLYTDENAKPIYWKTRLKHPDTGKKVIRSFSYNQKNKAFELKEPDFKTVYPQGNGLKPLYGLHHLATSPINEAAYIVEGEQKADALNRLGLIAVTSGGCSSCDGAYWQVLAGRRCFIFRDNDDAGQTYSDNVKAVLIAFGCEVYCVDVAKLGLEAKGDIIDWLKAFKLASGKEATKADIEALPIVAEDELQNLLPPNASIEWQAPQPLVMDNKQTMPYPVDAYPPIARAAIEAIAHHVQAPTAMVGQCVLGAMAYAAQRKVNAYDINYLNGKPCSLFLLTEGASGDRKSTAQRLANKAINDLEKASNMQYMDDMADYKEQLHQQKGKNAPPAEPENPKTIYTDATLEPIISAFIDGTKDAMLCTDEAGQFFGGHTMKSDTVTSSLGVLTKLWDNGMVERVRSKGNFNTSGIAYDKRFTLNLLGQREVIAQSINDPLMRAQGFLPRFLFAAPETLAGTRLLNVAKLHDRPENDERLKAYWHNMNMLLNDDIPQILGDTGDYAQRPVLIPTYDALEVWLDFFNETETAQSKGKQYEFFKPFAARGGELAHRVATVLAYFNDKREVDKQTMQSAIKLVKYSLSEVVRYSDEVVEDTRITDARKLEIWCINKCLKDNVLKLDDRTVMQYVTPKYLRKKNAVDNGVSILSEHNRMIMIERCIYINPELLQTGS